MVTEKPRWYQVGNRQPRLKDGGDWTDRQRTTDNPEALMPPPAAAPERSPADCDGGDGGTIADPGIGFDGDPVGHPDQ